MKVLYYKGRIVPIKDGKNHFYFIIYTLDLKYGGDVMYVVLNVDTDGSGIHRKTFQICKRYLTYIQNSVF